MLKLADGVVNNKFFDEVFDLGIVVVETASIFGHEDYAFHVFHLSGRAGETDLSGVGFDESSAPFLDLEVRASVDECLSVFSEFGFFAGGHSVFVFHQTFGVARAALGSGAGDGHYAGQRSHNGFDTVFEAATHGHFAFFVHSNVFSVSNLGDVEFFSDLGHYLSGVAVDCLAAAEDDVVVADFADGLRKGIRSSKGVGTAESAVGEDNAAVGATEDSFANNFGRFGQSHGEDGDSRAGVSVFEAERLFEGIQVFRVEDSGEDGAVDSTVFLHSIFAYVAGVGHLLSKHNDV